jgi:hypothetical protein
MCELHEFANNRIRKTRANSRERACAHSYISYTEKNMSKSDEPARRDFHCASRGRAVRACVRVHKRELLRVRVVIAQ